MIRRSLVVIECKTYPKSSWRLDTDLFHKNELDGDLKR